jgi:hypothetical protein
MARRASGIHMGHGVFLSVEGTDELKRQLERVGEIKKSIITKAARQGIDMILPQAIDDAPEKSGALKKGLRRRLERPRKRNKYKSVYRIIFDTKMTDIFRKDIVNPGVFGGTETTGYYPVSMEYGFLRENDRREGEYFIANAIEDNEKASSEKVVNVLIQEIRRLT